MIILHYYFFSYWIATITITIKLLSGIIQRVGQLQPKGYANMRVQLLDYKIENSN